VGILNSLSVSAKTAYSFRRINDDYLGSAIRVRRTNSTNTGDNAEINIGFDGSGNLDTTALLAHCTGANNYGYLVTKYDQSTNGFNATQTTAGNQPLLVSNGVVLVDTVGNPAPEYKPDATQRELNSGGGTTAQPYTISTVLKGATGAVNYLRDSGGFGVFAQYSSGFSNYRMAANTSQTFATGDSFAHNVFTNVFNGTSSFGVKNGTVSGALNVGTNSISNPKIGNTWVGYIQEVIMFSSVLSTTDRETLEADQNAYWINPPTSIDLNLSTLNIYKAIQNPDLNLSIELDLNTLNINKVLQSVEVILQGEPIELNLSTLNIQKVLQGLESNLSIELNLNTLDIAREVKDFEVTNSLELNLSTLNISKQIQDAEIILLGGVINLNLTTLNIAKSIQDLTANLSIELNLNTIDIDRNVQNFSIELIDRTINLYLTTLNILRNIKLIEIQVGIEVPVGEIGNVIYKFISRQKTVFILPNKNLQRRVVMKKFIKQSSEIIPITLDYSKMLQDSEIISTVEIAGYDSYGNNVSSSILDRYEIEGLAVKVVAKNGESTKRYKITVLVTTNQLNVYEEDVFMYINNI